MSKGKHNSKRGVAAVIEKAQKEGDALDTITVAEGLELNPRFPFLAFGRPKAIQGAEELEERMNKYLNDLGRWGLPTKAGLCFSLGISRETLYRYEKDADFRDTLKHYYQLFEDMWAQRLSSANATGTIFYMKNAFKDDYKDRYDSDHTGRIIHYVLPAEIASKHGVPITKAEIIDQNHAEQNSRNEAALPEAIARASDPVQESQPAQQQAEDGGARPQPDEEAGADAHQHQLEEEDREMPEAVR